MVIMGECIFDVLFFGTKMNIFLIVMNIFDNLFRINVFLSYNNVDKA